MTEGEPNKKYIIPKELANLAEWFIKNTEGQSYAYMHVKSTEGTPIFTYSSVSKTPESEVKPIRKRRTPKKG
jgi:hypothetical protein